MTTTHTDTFTPDEYESVAASIIASQALSGITITREEVDAAWETVKGEPLPDLLSVSADAAAAGVVRWPDVAPMPELRNLKPLSWERAREMGFPYNVPCGADEEEDEQKRKSR